MQGAVAGTGTGTGNGIGSRSASSVRLMRVAYLQALPNQLLSCCFKPTEKPLNANTYSGIDKARMGEAVGAGEMRGEQKRNWHCCGAREERAGNVWPMAVASSSSRSLALSSHAPNYMCK